MNAARIRDKSGSTATLVEAADQALREAGRRGLTRVELAARIGAIRGRACKESSACGVVGALRKLGRIVDTGETRMGDCGVHVGVVVHADCYNGSRPRPAA
ncbi:MAG: hypothetical protein ACF8PN_06805 [Phycisphaerales bacterium]